MIKILYIYFLEIQGVKIKCIFIPLFFENIVLMHFSYLFLDFKFLNFILFINHFMQ